VVEEREKWSEERWEERMRQEMLVDHREKRDDKGRWCGYTYNVRVISWLIYYGHHQIIHYILQLVQQHNDMSELFRVAGDAQNSSELRIVKRMKDMISDRFRSRQRRVEEYRLLLLGCYSGDVQTVRVLLPVCKRAINDVDQICGDNDWCWYSPLTIACKIGHMDVMEEVVGKAWADVNLKLRLGNTPLIVACEGGHVSMVEELVKAGADVNLQNRYGDTPLIAACEGGHVSVVVELVKAGADVNLQNRYGDTPLIAACKGGHVSVVTELVKAGADVNLQGRWGITPLTASLGRGHVSVVTELVKAGADVNLQDR
jgi:ribosomal 50S subunit-recycling heat shock protein